MNQYLQKHLQIFFRDLTSFGGTAFYIFLIVFLLPFNQTLAIKLIFGFLFSFAVVLLIRTFYFKNRPSKETHQNYIEKIEASSFPSWHTARAVFLALIFIFFFQNPTITILLIILAFLTAYSRIHIRKHDWVDVLGGAILGVITYWLSGFI